jgi:hypothetical protein
MGMRVTKKRRYEQMKKLIFVLIIIPPALLYAACNEPPLSSALDDPDVPDVVITDDWRYITIYLDGAHMTANAPATPAENKLAASSRNLTPDTARRGFDFFEVFFYANGDIVRESWEIGTRASVYGVHRGAEYSRVSLGALGVGEAAIIFAGRKRDKTLLGVGRVFSVDDVPGATVTADSSYVTFEVFALTGKLNYDEYGKPQHKTVSYDANESCFLTMYDDAAESAVISVENTLIMEAVIGNRSFPLYKLPQGKKSVKANYQFGLDGIDWEDFKYGVLVSSVYDGNNGGIESGSATIRNARYPAGNGKYWYPAYPLDRTTNVKMTNNQIVGRPVENVVEFEFDTEYSTHKALGPEIGVFTLGFRIPVSPLIAAKEPGFVSPSDDGEVASQGDITWFIRPAYQSYYYNIDNGVDSYGGGVLMGVFGAYETELVVSRRSG